MQIIKKSHNFRHCDYKEPDFEVQNRLSGQSLLVKPEFVDNFFPLSRTRVFWTSHFGQNLVLERTVQCSRTVRVLVMFGRFEVRFWAKLRCLEVFEVRSWSSANISEHFGPYFDVGKREKEGKNLLIFFKILNLFFVYIFFMVLLPVKFTGQTAGKK